MALTWEEYKRSKQKEFGTLDVPVIEPKTPRARYDAPAIEAVPLYEIKKILLPIDPEYPDGKVVVSHVTKAEADWWLEFKLKVKVFYDDETDTKTLVFYEKFLIGGTPKERNIYSNPARFCTEDVPDFLKTPRRIE